MKWPQEDTISESRRQYPMVLGLPDFVVFDYQSVVTSGLQVLVPRLSGQEGDFRDPLPNRNEEVKCHQGPEGTSTSGVRLETKVTCSSGRTHRRQRD